MDEQEKVKKLKLMRFWVFGTFVIVAAGVAAAATSTGLMSFFNQVSDGLIAIAQVVWPIWAAAAVACIAAYYGYKILYIDRK